MRTPNDEERRVKCNWPRWLFIDRLGPVVIKGVARNFAKQSLNGLGGMFTKGARNHGRKGEKGAIWKIR